MFRLGTNHIKSWGVTNVTDRSSESKPFLETSFGKGLVTLEDFRNADLKEFLALGSGPGNPK